MKYFTLIFLLCCAGRRGMAALSRNEEGDTESSSASGSSTGSFPEIKEHINCVFHAENDVKFYLHNQKDLKNPHKLNFNSKLGPKTVNSQWKTVVYIHGWIKEARLTEILKKAFLEENNQKVNLIEVDWLSDSHNPFYCPTIRNVPKVGEIVAKFIGLNKGKFNLEKLSIIGQGLGSHAAGFAGKFLQSTFKFKLRSIVALDPAGPYFHGITEKLQPNDANEVIVFHTSDLFGHSEPLGTLDIYLNGGMWQPGCTDVQSHAFAEVFYNEFIRGKKPLVGHLYSSFDEAERGIIPKTKEIKLFDGKALPPNGTLVYVSTQEKQRLFEEVKEYFDAKNSQFNM